MFCRNCKFELSDKAVACTNCGMQPLAGTKVCHNCCNATIDQAIVCTKCGVSLEATTSNNPSEKRMLAGLFAILLGWLGIHKFFLGYTVQGIIMLVITVITFGLAGIIMFIIGLIEGVIYLSKSDSEFEQIYISNKKGWF